MAMASSIALSLDSGVIPSRTSFAIPVHPCSMSIESTLGNLRLCDKSLGDEHCWCWLCDIRNPGVESLIKLTFNSYSRDDEDYEGYDYSPRGRLSAVRIVYLYRFVREVSPNSTVWLFGRLLGRELL